MLIFSDEQTIYGSFRTAVKVAGAEDDNILHTTKDQIIMTVFPFHMLYYMLMEAGALHYTKRHSHWTFTHWSWSVFSYKIQSFLVKVDVAYRKYRSETLNR